MVIQPINQRECLDIDKDQKRKVLLKVKENVMKFV